MYKFLDETKSNLAVDEDTGEVTEAKAVIIPIGSRVITPKQQEVYDELKERQIKREMRRKIQDELGYFYFVMREHKFGNISAESAARLIYLCAYLNYTNEFMLTEKQKMKKSDLQDILGLCTGTTHKFWKEVCDVYISDFGEEGLKLCCSEIVRGKLSDTTCQYQKVYIESIRNIYRATPPTKHRYLGYIFQLLPYINIEYNIICENPRETELDKIKPLKISEICDILGYDRKNIKRFKNIYKQLVFDYRGQKERLFTFFSYWNEDANMRACINPHILYCGSDYRKVEILGAFVQIE